MFTRITITLQHMMLGNTITLQHNFPRQNDSLDLFTIQTMIEIKYSSASSLRAQLREIAPMNDEGTKIFCPNGPSAAVSPMMENKCSDRQALPSVYGRSDDAMGNSIPGFGGTSPSLLRAQLEEQAYFRSN